MNDTATLDMVPPEVRAPRKPITSADREAARVLRAQKLAEKHEAKRWVVVESPGTVDEYVWDHCRCGTYHEALRMGSDCGVRFDVMFRLPDGSLTTEF